MTVSIFISYAKEDIALVRNIYLALREKGFLPWLDEYDILPGQEWKETIAQRIHDAQIVLICLSHNSVDKRGYFQKEIKLALDVYDEIPEGNIFLIPLRLEEIAVPERLSKFQWADVFSPDGLDKLIFSINYQKEKLEILSISSRIQKHSVFLDFQTITNPVSLLQSLVIFQNTHESILVGEHNLHAIEWLEEPGGPTPMPLSLLDNSYLQHLESYHGYPYADLELSEANLLLALRILNFAIEEQFVKVEKVSDNPLLSKFINQNWQTIRDVHSDAPQFSTTFKNIESEITTNKQLTALRSRISRIVAMGAGKSMSKKWSGGFLLTPCYVDADYGATYSNQQYDLSLSLRKNYHLVVDGDINAFPTDEVFKDMINNNSTLYQETIEAISPEKFYDYQKMIEIAGLFPQIVDAIRENILQIANTKEFHWFNPSLNSTSMTKISSKVLYSIIKRRFANSEN